MNTKTLLSIAILAGSGFAALGAGCATEQPKVKCLVAGGIFSTRFIPTGTPTGTCTAYKPLRAMDVGAQFYNPQLREGIPDPEVTDVAFQPKAIGTVRNNARDFKTVDGGSAADPNEKNLPYSIGRFATSLPVNGFCAAPTLSPAEQNTAESFDPNANDAGGAVKQKPVSVKYEWADMNVKVLASEVGTQFAANLKHTLNGCTAEYRTYGVYAGNFTTCQVILGGDPQVNEDGTPVVDDRLCNATASNVPDAGDNAFVANGIGPDAVTVCDKISARCLLAADPVTGTPAPQ
jgi:hypothetical protein